MNALKSHRELDDVPEQLAIDSVAIGEQPLHLCQNIFGQRRLPAADFVGIALVIAPTEYQSLRLPLVRVWSMACSSLMSYPVSAPLPRSIIMSMRRKWLTVSMMSPALTLSSLTPGGWFRRCRASDRGSGVCPRCGWSGSSGRSGFYGKCRRRACWLVHPAGSPAA